MFVEGTIEIKIKDRSALGLDDHQTKLWIQRSFKDMCCYRIASFERDTDKMVRATVALKTDVLPEGERQILESNANDSGTLRSFIEKMFEGKGTIRAIGDAKLRAN